VTRSYEVRVYGLVLSDVILREFPGAGGVRAVRAGLLLDPVPRRDAFGPRVTKVGAGSCRLMRSSADRLLW